MKDNQEINLYEAFSVEELEERLELAGLEAPDAVPLKCDNKCNKPTDDTVA